ncbi:hypothetical protein Bca52824_071775 [Brassica carinata]|uniref:Uncharacterized protein n=1 Tax=Brassica carinata TaxID=52824 RepID=A0A8X7U6C5_BRACI|nr:hypothetical protein Bca52824_071775 [Brassica carinata]
MDMKMVDSKVVARDEEMVVDTVEVEDGRVGGIRRWRWRWWLTPEWRPWWLWIHRRWIRKWIQRWRLW